MERRILIYLLLLVFLGASFATIKNLLGENKTLNVKPEPKDKASNNQEQPYVSPTPSATPTPKPLTFSEMNNLYGPCVKLPVLMYHHIQDEKVAETGGYQKLIVTPEFFEKQIKYLKDNGYQSLAPNRLINFFDSAGSIPGKSVILTFDDGYEDLYSQAYPILKKYGFFGVSFLPTGLVKNPGYLNWGEISELSDSNYFYFGNHTWSHHSVITNDETVKKEIETADTQLTEHKLNSSKIFAAPYGGEDAFTLSFLGKIGYKLAFTTKPGSILCKAQRFVLPRIRIGNAALSAYGF